jgi:hypothetical protein
MNTIIARWCILGLAAVTGATTACAAIVGQSTSTTGQLQYVGLGDVGGGVGSGQYTLGDCAFAAGTTVCTLSGSYTESAQSTHTPGQGGTFTLTMSYSGNGTTPVVARSVSANSDILQFATVGTAVFKLTLHPTSGGEVVGLYPAAVFADSINFSAFLDPTNYSCAGLAVSQPCTVGQVGVTPGATIKGPIKPLQFSFPEGFDVSGPNYQGLWWNSPGESESGWGINLAHQNDVIFATWFTYDISGKAWWLTMTATKSAEGIYGGTLYQTNGAPFNAFVPPVTLTPVGTGTLSFTSATSGTFTYTVNGSTQTKNIVPQIFRTPPSCAWGAEPDLTKATNFQDLWWAFPADSESGWGINFTHQDTIIFATWFTYDINHSPLWYSVTAEETSPNTFTGKLARTTGPAFNAVPFDPTKVIRTFVGTATFSFADGNHATFAYQVNDGSNVATQTKNITRQVFRAPGTVCHQ